MIVTKEWKSTRMIEIRISRSELHRLVGMCKPKEQEDRRIFLELKAALKIADDCA